MTSTSKAGAVLLKSWRNLLSAASSEAGIEFAEPQDHQKRHLSVRQDDSRSQTQSSFNQGRRIAGVSSREMGRHCARLERVESQSLQTDDSSGQVASSDERNATHPERTTNEKKAKVPAEDPDPSTEFDDTKHASQYVFRAPCDYFDLHHELGTLYESRTLAPEVPEAAGESWPKTAREDSIPALRDYYDAAGYAAVLHERLIDLQYESSEAAAKRQLDGHLPSLLESKSEIDLNRRRVKLRDDLYQARIKAFDLLQCCSDEGTEAQYPSSLLEPVASSGLSIHDVPFPNVFETRPEIGLSRAKRKLKEELQKARRQALADLFQQYKVQGVKREDHSRSLLPRWKQELIVKPRSCVDFWMDLISYLPAILYSLSGWVPICIKLDQKVQIGFQIANGVLFGVLSAMGLFQGRISGENRWYVQRYILWSVLLHVVTSLFGFYSNLDVDGSQSTQALDISSVVQAVQTLPLWSVELLHVETVKLKKND